MMVLLSRCAVVYSYLDVIHHYLALTSIICYFFGVDVVRVSVVGAPSATPSFRKNTSAAYAKIRIPSFQTYTIGID